jgi:hypothetical protein
MKSSSSFDIFEDVTWSRDPHSLMLPFMKVRFEVGMVAYVSESTGHKRERLQSVILSDKPQTMRLQNTA